jgi:hypothetical protein
MRELTMNERKKLVNILHKRYVKASKKDKTKILDEFIQTTGYNRSYGAHLLKTHVKKKKAKRLSNRKAGRKKLYTKDVLESLVLVWKIMDFACGKRLRPVMGEAVNNLEKYGHSSIAQRVKEKLLRMSASTIDRMLKGERKKFEIKGRSHTKPGTLLNEQIKIKTFSEWSDSKVGFLQVDLVGHDGGDPKGDFCYSLDMVDVVSGWDEVVAIKNKAQIWTVQAIDTVRKRLPFEMLGINSDNGSEFINAHLLKYCESNKIDFTRSRKYKKNDNSHVKQKNWSVVRRDVGYLRYDTTQELKLLNKLYGYLRLYNNHFQASMKLIEKIRDGSKVTKRYDTPTTPYERVLNSKNVSQEIKKTLQAEHETLDLYDLKRNIVKCANKLFKIQEKKKTERRHLDSVRF